MASVQETSTGWGLRNCEGGQVHLVQLVVVQIQSIVQLLEQLQHIVQLLELLQLILYS